MIWMDRPPASPTPMSCSTTARTTVSPRITAARSSRPGTPLCARVMSGACISAVRAPAAAPPSRWCRRRCKPWRGAGAADRGCCCSACESRRAAHRSCSQWQGLQDHGNQSTVRAGTEIEVKTERPEVSLSMSEMDLGSWVIFELPGFTHAASGTEQGSMDAMRKANETSYFRGGDALWVKLVVTKAPVLPIRPNDMQASIAVSRISSVSRTERSPGRKSGGLYSNVREKTLIYGDGGGSADPPLVMHESWKPGFLKRRMISYSLLCGTLPPRSFALGYAPICTIPDRSLAPQAMGCLSTNSPSSVRTSRCAVRKGPLFQSALLK